MVFQKHLLFPHMTVGENVAFGLKMRGVDRATIRRRVEELLELVQLGGYAARRSHELSGGQQQRVALARALIVEPKVLLLDEPLANLDANLRLEMRKLIRTAQQTLGMTTLFVTHDQEEAVMLADRVALMMDGRLLQAGCPRTLYERPASAAVARFFRNENRLPGIKRGTRVETPLGEIVLAGSPLPDGPVRVTVRPEHVQRLTPGKHGDDCPNTLVGQVLNTVYMGAHVQAQVAFDRWTWTVHLPPEQDIAVGAPCAFYMPPERVWLLPDSV
jgi:putative spermidine/putrescine transport system ATP-binding protein